MRLNRRATYQRALGISTILLSLWLLVLAPPSAAGTDGGGSDAGVPPTIPGLVPGNANAPVAVSVILSQAPALAAPAASRVSIQSAVAAQQGSFEARARALDPSVRVVSSQPQLLNRVTVSVPRHPRVLDADARGLPQGCDDVPGRAGRHPEGHRRPLLL